MLSRRERSPATVAAQGRVFHCTLRGDPDSVRRALGAVRRALESAPCAPGWSPTAELVLAEVLNNVVEHGYRGAGGLIELTVCTCPEGLFCTVTDDGWPMPGGALPDAAAPCPARCAEMLPEGGFGWLLIREFASDLSYGRRGARNHLRFLLPSQQNTRF